MKVNLTSNISTYFWKYFFPLLMVITFIYGLYAFLFMKVENYDFSVFLFLIPMSIFSIYYAFRLSFVQGDNSYLYVKGFGKTEKISLKLIKHVSELNVRNSEITIHFKEKTSFGKKITFIPYSKWFRFGTDHPVLKEIQKYIVKNEEE